MSYELTIPLSAGTLEIESDTIEGLERKLDKLDVGRVERALLAALRRKGPAKKGRKARRAPSKKKPGKGRARKAR